MDHNCISTILLKTFPEGFLLFCEFNQRIWHIAVDNLSHPRKYSLRFRIESSHLCAIILTVEYPKMGRDIPALVVILVQRLDPSTRERVKESVGNTEDQGTKVNQKPVRKVLKDNNLSLPAQNTGGEQR